MKYLLLIAFLLGFFQMNSLAQKLKYKDIYPIIQAKRYTEAYRKLKQYQVLEAENANTLYQLGRISDYRAQDYDVLIDGKLALRYADSAAFYYSKALKVIDEKELRRNGEYYEEFQKIDPKNPKKFNIYLKEVQSKLTDRVNHYTKFKDHVSHILIDFYQSVGYYDEATKIFEKINLAYPTLKELYLRANDSLLIKLNRLQLTFDSSAYYLEKYIQASKVYPIASYKQNYRILPIQTYRLDGLVSRVDFLKSDLILWNYGEWVNNFRKILNSDIKNLKEKTQLIENELNTKIKLGINGELSRGVIMYEPDRKSIFLLEKYDYNSWLLRLIRYKQKKIHFYESVNARPDSTEMLDFTKNIHYYHNIWQELKRADKRWQSLKEASIVREMNKHSSFINHNFESPANFQNYLTIEKDFISNQNTDYHQKIKTSLIENYQTLQNTNRIITTSNNEKISIFEQSLGLLPLTEVGYITLSVKQDLEGNHYFAGLKKDKNAKWQAFIAKSNAKDKLEWLQKMDFKIEGVKAFNSLVNALVVTDVGCMAIQTCVNMTGDTLILNRLIKMDSKGKLIESKNLEIFNLPRQLDYLVDTGEIVIVHTH